jgi:hypothetical protein
MFDAVFQIASPTVPPVAEPRKVELDLAHELRQAGPFPALKRDLPLPEILVYPLLQMKPPLNCHLGIAVIAVRPHPHRQVKVVPI